MQNTEKGKFELGSTPSGAIKNAVFETLLYRILYGLPNRDRTASKELFDSVHMLLQRIGAHLLLAQAACRVGKRVKFQTAQALVNQLEEAQKNYRLERLLTALEKVDLLIVDELGYIGFSRGGAELLFQVFADRYERGSIRITSNLPFGEWGSIFQGARMTAALLDRFTHRCHVLEMNGESYRFREPSKAAKAKEKATTK